MLNRKRHGADGIGVRFGGRRFLFREERFSRAAASRMTSVDCRRSPQADPPEKEPSLRRTRWHGMANSSGLCEHALPTARTAFGEPIFAAIAAKVVVCPKGTVNTAAQTRR